MKSIRLDSTLEQFVFLTSSYEVEDNVENTVDEIIKFQPVLSISKVGKTITKQYGQIEGEKESFKFHCTIREVAQNKALVILILYPYWFHVVATILFFVLGLWAVIIHFLNIGVKGSDHLEVGSVLLFLSTAITILIFRGMKKWRSRFEEVIHVVQQ